MRHLLLLLLPLLALLGAPAIAAPLEAIDISGNQRIENSTIENYLKIARGEEITKKKINESLKSLFDTGFFSDVKITLNGDSLAVNVLENPSINQIAFEGNKQLKQEDLEKEISLRARSVYNRTTVQNDVKRLLDVYRRSGYFSAEINPKIIQREQNRVDLVFEIVEGPETSIRRISFIGNKAYSATALESVIKSSKSAWYQFLTNDDKYDPDKLEYDKELLRRFYRSEGYADFRVKSAFAELTPDRKAFYLTFTIEEGIQYRFGKIDVENSLNEQDLTFDEEITTQAGETYDANEVEVSIDNMVSRLGDKGFAFVDVEPSLARNKDSQTVDLTYIIKPGPRVYVEKIDIVGNISTLDEVIRREFRLAEGDAYSTSLLRRSEQRLKNLGYFEDVKIDTEPGTMPDKTTIKVAVKEKSTGEVSLGAGFSTVDGPLADVGIRERNLLGRGQDLRLRVLAAARRQQYDIGFTEPYLLDRELSGGFDLYRIVQDFRQESSFDRKATGAKLRAGYSFSEKLTHQVFYKIEQNEVANVDSRASRFIRDQEGEFLTSLVGHTLLYDDRDNRFAPTSGYLLRLNQEIAGLGGDDKFLRHEAQAEYYYPIASQWVFAFAGSAGHIHPLEDDIRINQRFFLGGRELRGFDNSGIGPRDITTRDALGGTRYYTASSELRFPLGLPDDFGVTGAVFTDVGSLWNVSDEGPEVVGADAALRVASGIGVAWSSPFGPIRIDFSKAIVKEDFDDEEVVRIGFGTRF